MTPSQLHVVTAYSNPIRWSSRLKLYKDFERHMLESGVRLTVVECVFGDEPPQITPALGVTHVRVYAKTLVWTKENLLNLGISRLPHDWKYVAWVDADIMWRKPDWAMETLHALQHFDFVQPWEICYDLGPNDEHLQVHHSFGRQWAKDPLNISKMGAGYTFAHPGYAMAATRSALEKVGGLMEHAILGAGDHHMALALIGRSNLSVPGKINPNYFAKVQAWQDRCRMHVNGNLGYIPFNIEHFWHGCKKKRAYVDRWSILTDHDYDPNVDIIYNTSGIIELAGNKPELRRAIWRYFNDRDEDANSM